MIEYLSLPFVQRAVLAGLIFALLAGMIGVFMTMRRAAFFGDAVAHSSLAGIAIGLLVGLNPLVTAFVYALAIAWLLPEIRKKTSFSFDNLLGIILPVSLGLGVILFNLLPGFQPQLLSYLFGSMLLISWNDVIFFIVLLIVVKFVMKFIRDRLVLVSLDPDYARLIGIPITRYELIYHFLLALTIISGVRLIGIVLMNALLIIPASIARLYSKSLTTYFWLTPLIGLVCVLLGIIVSLSLNVPTGATIAVTAGVLFAISLVIKKVF